MPSQIFDYFDYREYLKARVSRKRGAPRGLRAALAKAIPCQPSYFSRALNGESNFSLEQAEAVSRFLGHSKEETNYFFLLVQYARAGTDGVKAHFKESIERVHTERLVLKKRVGVDHTLSRENQAIYYSAWYYAALHVMTGIPSLQTKEAMGRALQLPLNKVSEALSFLSSVGLVQQTSDGNFVTGLGKLHLERNSPMLARHHANWRIQAIRSVERDFEESLHYSVLVNVSEKDAQKLRKMIADFIEDFMKIVHPSSDETMLSFNVDLFRPET